MKTLSLADRFNSANTLTKAMITAGLLLGLLLVLAFLTMLERPADLSNAGPRKPAKVTGPTPQQVQTVVVRQDAEGYSDRDLTPEAMKIVENEIVNRTLQRARENLNAQGQSADEVIAEKVASSSWIMEASGRRFGIVDVQTIGGRIKAVVSIQSGQLVRVSCINSTGENIPTFTGKCAEEIEKVFEVRLPAPNGG